MIMMMEDDEQEEEEEEEGEEVNTHNSKKRGKLYNTKNGDDSDKRNAKKQKTKHNSNSNDNARDTGSFYTVELDNKKKGVTRQTFVFSATLTLKEQQQLEKIQKQQQHIKKSSHKGPRTVMDVLRDLVEFQRKLEIIDLSTKHVIVDRITQSKIDCLAEEKDYYLYYLLGTGKGRTLIFVNTIGCIKRLYPLVSLLFKGALNIFSLHANMQQRQRLKHLEKFSSCPDAVLIATDVAARGLDIPSVDNVIHYELPQSTELYIHRSGRTARAANTGSTVLLLGPQDKYNYMKLCNALSKANNSDDHSSSGGGGGDESRFFIPNLKVDMSYLPAIRKRVNLARRLEHQIYEYTKLAKNNTDWITKLAADAGIVPKKATASKKKSNKKGGDSDSDDDTGGLDINSGEIDFAALDASEDDDEETRMALKGQKLHIDQLKKEFNTLLQKPLFANRGTAVLGNASLLKSNIATSSAASSNNKNNDKNSSNNDSNDGPAKIDVHSLPLPASLSGVILKENYKGEKYSANKQHVFAQMSKQRADKRKRK